MKIVLIPRTGAIVVLAMMLFVLTYCSAQFSGTAVSPESAYSIPQAQLIQPGVLNHLLQARGTPKPLILQVGSHVLFAEAHIQGAEYAGPGSQSYGIKLLQDRVASLSHNSFIVLYCGCCPWNHCPNLGPAYWQLHNLGFTHVKVLYLPYNFGADWVNKGYLVESGR